MRCLRLSLLLLTFLAVSSLSAQSDALRQQVESIFSGPHDEEQLDNLNVALTEMINTMQIVPDTLFEQAIAMAYELDAPAFVANLYLNRSVYDMNSGNLTKGMVHAEKAIETAQAINDKSFEADAYDMKLRIMMTGGEIEDAADIASDLVKKYQAQGDTINEALTYILLSRLSTSLGNYPMTLMYDSIAINLARQTGNDKILTRSLYSSAENLVFLEYPAEGLALATEAMALARKNNLGTTSIGNIINARMGANIALGNYEEACKDLAIMEEFVGEQKFAWWMTTQGLLLQRIGRNQEAREVLLEALEMLKVTSDSPISLKRTYCALQTVDLGQMEYDTVVHYGRLIKEQDDSLQITRNIRHLQELEEKYQAGEKEAEIRLQKEKLAAQQKQLYLSVGGLLFALLAVLGYFLLTRRLKKRNIENENLLREKETLMGEIHHRVKNNLQVVSSLLQIQRRGLESDDEKGREALLESQNRVSAMGLIHNKLYQGEEVTSVHLPDYLKDLGETLLDAYRLEEQVEMFFDIEDIRLDVDSAIPLGLIVNELITNSLKYAFPKGREGTVEIVLHRNERHLVLRVSDDGVGTAAAEKRADSTSFGSNLIGLLVKKLGGSLTVLEGQGYGVEVLFFE